MTKKKEAFDLRPIPKECELTILNVRGPGNSRFQTIKRFISDAFLAKILAGSLPKLRRLQSSRYLVPTFRMIYMMLAILVRNQGLNVTVMLSKTCPRSLLTVAASTLTSNIPRPIVSRKYTKKLMTYYLFSATYYSNISASFMGIIRSLCEAVTGDVNPKRIYFRDNCPALADEIYAYACTLKD